MQAQMMAMSAAFTAGVQAGQKLNQVFKTDMSLWNEAVDSFGTRGGIIIKALADGFVGLGNVIAAAATLNKEELDRAANDFGATAETMLQHIKTAMTGSAEEVGKLTGATRDNKAAHEELAKSVVAFTEEVKKTGEQLTVYEQQQSAATERVEALTEAVAKQSAAITDKEQRLAQENDRIKELIQTYGMDSQITKQAIEEKEHMARSLEFQKQKLDDTRSALKDASREQDEATAAVQRYRDKMKSLSDDLPGVVDGTKKFGEEAKKQASNVNELGFTAEALAKHMRAIGESKPDASLQALKDMNKELRDLVTNATDAAKAVKAFAEAGGGSVGVEAPAVDVSTKK